MALSAAESIAPFTLIVGAGYTGGRLLASLPKKSAAVLSRSRDPALGKQLAPFDLDTDSALPRSLARRLGGGFAVVYTVPPAPGEDSDPRLARLLEILPAAPNRLVYLSTTGVYGDCGGKRVDESAPTNPQTDRSLRRVIAEQQLARWSRDSTAELLVLRVPGIYGPGRLGLDRIRNGRPVIREAEANPGNRIHVDDLVSCCSAALRRDVPAGTYNVGDGDERSSTWFAGETALQAGLQAPPTVRRIEAEQLFSTGRLSFLRESRRLDLTRMQQLLRPAIAYPDATDGIAASLRDEGLAGR